MDVLECRSKTGHRTVAAASRCRGCRSAVYPRLHVAATDSVTVADEVLAREMVDAFARGGDGVLEAAASIHTPRHVLHAIAGDTYRVAHVVLAANPATPSGLLDNLAFWGRRDTPLVTALAANPSTGVAALEMLAGLDRHDTTEVLVRRPNCPPSIVSEAAGSRYPDLREIVASRADLSEALQIHLAQDPIERVRLAIAANPVVTQTIADVAIHGREQVFVSLGINPDNHRARAYVELRRWWTMTPDSVHVEQALTLFPNAR